MQSRPLLTLTIAATATLTANRFVTVGGAVCGAAGDALGVARTSASSGDQVPVDVAGTAVVEAGGTIAAGQYVQSDADGKAVAASASAIKTAVIAGGAAGDHTVTGIATTDRLISVVQLNRDATASNITAAALTGEFTISAANTINNASGTATTGDVLIVTYESARPVKGRALSAASSGDLIEVLLQN
ncbi:MAG: DUF2190 family protein [Xanthomonadales bacterium]|nr:hypothetical protein [Anaerolineae bacterium]MCC6593001.1 DUF2190 family protein [Xanthomonadales bacterium]